MMRSKILIFSLILILLAQKVIAGEDPQEKNSYQSLVILGKVWGVLKYYHPNSVILFKKNATDSLLFESIKELEDGNGINEVIHKLILSFSSNPNTISNSIELKDTLLNKLDDYNKADLSVVLNSYIGFKNPYYYNKESDLVFFKNENTYNEFDTYPPKEIRLLALFRSYHFLYYFYPYKEQIDENLDQLLIEFIPLVIDAKDDVEFHSCIFRFFAHVKDSHTLIFSKAFFDKWYWEGFYPPIHINRENSVFIIGKILNDVSPPFFQQV